MWCTPATWLKSGLSAVAVSEFTKNQSRKPLGNGTPSSADPAERVPNNIKIPARPKATANLLSISVPLHCLVHVASHREGTETKDRGGTVARATVRGPTHWADAIRLSNSGPRGNSGVVFRRRPETDCRHAPA